MPKGKNGSQTEAIKKMLSELQPTIRRLGLSDHHVISSKVREIRRLAVSNPDRAERVLNALPALIAHHQR